MMMEILNETLPDDPDIDNGAYTIDVYLIWSE